MPATSFMVSGVSFLYKAQSEYVVQQYQVTIVWLVVIYPVIQQLSSFILPISVYLRWKQKLLKEFASSQVLDGKWVYETYKT